MTDEERARARELIEMMTWHFAKTYAKTAPHYYARRHEHGPEWQEFREIIGRHRKPRQWHGHEYQYLQVDGDVFWVMLPVINRAPATTLDDGGAEP